MMRHIALLVALCAIPSIAESRIIINEIAWMGTPIEEVAAKQHWRHEWIELFNASESNAIDVSGWTIELYRADLDFQIPLAGTIAPQDYFVVGASDKIPGVDLNYSNLSGKFANGGQLVIVRDATRTIVEEVDARAGWFAGDNEEKITMERWSVNRVASDVENWFPSIYVGGSPGAENSISEKTQEELLGTKSEEEGRQEALSFLAQQEKDPLGSQSHLSFGIVVIAAVTALLSVLLMLALKVYLQRSSAGQRQQLD